MLLRGVGPNYPVCISVIPFHGIVSARQQKRRRAHIEEAGEAVRGHRRVGYPDSRDARRLATGSDPAAAIVRDDAGFYIQLNGRRAIGKSSEASGVLRSNAVPHGDIRPIQRE
jgi:hypothetical protein